MADSIQDQYIRRNPKSAALFPKFQQVFAAGGAGNDAPMATPFPLTYERGLGSRKWDVDGNEYIDYQIGSASLLLGHAHPEVVAAVQAAVPNGSAFGAPTEQVLEWGQRVIDLVPCAEKVRFVGSGSEATAMAIRIARAYTGKDKIVRWEGHFHGHHDYVQPGNVYPYDVSSSTGIPQGALDSVITLPVDLDVLDRILSSDKEIAGVITEGSGASYGTVPLPPGFVQGVRDLTTKHNVVMILDEVITGFRWSSGGLQKKLGITPDICSMAKILTGGLAGGGVAGQDEFMRVMDLTGDAHRDRFERVLHSGTFNANPYTTAGGNAALKIAGTGEMQAQADRMAERLRGGLRQIVDKYEVAACVYGEASTFHIYFGGTSIEGLDANTLKVPKPALERALRQAINVRGVDLMSRTSGVTSGVHTENDIDLSLEAFDGAFKAMMDEGLITHT